MFADIWHMPALYIFEQRGSDLNKMRATCQRISPILAMRDLDFTEQLVGYYGAHTNDQPCKIDESLISDIHWILGSKMYSSYKISEGWAQSVLCWSQRQGNAFWWCLCLFLFVWVMFHWSACNSWVWISAFQSSPTKKKRTFSPHQFPINILCCEMERAKHLGDPPSPLCRARQRLQTNSSLYRGEPGELWTLLCYLISLRTHQQLFHHEP